MKRNKKVIALVLAIVLSTIVSSQVFASSVSRTNSDGQTVTATLNRNTSGATASTVANYNTGVVAGITIYYYVKEDPNKQYTSGAGNYSATGSVSVSQSVSSIFYCYYATSSHSCPDFGFNESLSE